MLFPTHLAAAYALGRRWDTSSRWTYWAVAGAALPDLIDKPAAMAGLVPLYHSLGHSLLALLGAFAVVFLRRAWTPLWVGWASHLLLDASHVILNGRPEDVLFLAWPAVEHRPAVFLPPLDFFVHYLGTPSFYVEMPIWAAFAYVLVHGDA